MRVLPRSRDRTPALLGSSRSMAADSRCRHYAPGRRGRPQPPRPQSRGSTPRSLSGRTLTRPTDSRPENRSAGAPSGTIKGAQKNGEGRTDETRSAPAFRSFPMGEKPPARPSHRARARAEKRARATFTVASLGRRRRSVAGRQGESVCVGTPCARLPPRDGVLAARLEAPVAPRVTCQPRTQPSLRHFRAGPPHGTPALHPARGDPGGQQPHTAPPQRSHLRPPLRAGPDHRHNDGTPWFAW